MAKVCQICKEDPKKRALPLAKKCPRRRPYLGLYTVRANDDEPEETMQVCRACFELGKDRISLRSAKPPRSYRPLKK